MKSERINLAEAIESYCLKKSRKDIFKKDFPQAFYYYDLKLDKKNIDLTIDNKKVVKLRLCVGILYFPDKDTLLIQPGHSACLYLRNADGSRSVRTVKKNKIEKLTTALLNSSAEMNTTFIRMDSLPIGWNVKSVNEIYYNKKNTSTNPHRFYNQVHQLIIDQLLHLMEKHKLNNLNIIDGGCGDGSMLKKINKKMKEKFKDSKIYLVGFDINKKNIIECQENSDQIYFFQNSLSNIEYIIKKSIDNQSLDPTLPTILTLSGSLTRLVLSDSYEGVEILQKCYLQHIEYLIGDGVGEPLITDFIAKRIGYKPVKDIKQDNDFSRNFFLYQKMTDEEILDNKIKKIEKNNFLDLSLCPNPIYFLKKIAEKGYIKDNLTIDISHCDLSAEFIKTIQDLLNNNNGIKLIFFHHSSSMISRFEQEIIFLKFKNEVKFVTKFTDPSHKKDAYLMAPKPFIFTLFPREEKNVSPEKIRERLLKSSENNEKNIFQYLLMSLNLPHTESIVASEINNEIEKFKEECEDIPDNERFIKTHHKKSAKKIIDKALQGKIKNYIKSLENSYYNTGNIAVVPHLLYIYRNGIPIVRINSKGYPRTYIFAKNTKKEMDLYYDLAEKNPEIKESIRETALWTLNYRQNSKEASRARNKIKDFGWEVPPTIRKESP